MGKLEVRQDMAKYEGMAENLGVRYEALKKLRERKGLTIERKDVELELFNVSTFEELVTFIERAAQFALLNDMWRNEDGIEALLNAYGLSGDAPSPSVIERRRSYAERAEISMRTVERREEAGLRAVHDIMLAMMSGMFGNWTEARIQGFQEVYDWWRKSGIPLF